MSRIVRMAFVGLVALLTLGVAAQSVAGLDDCYSALSVEAHPGCCQRTPADALEDPAHGCCRATFLVERTSSGTVSSSPAIFAPAVVSWTVAVPQAAGLEASVRGRPVERPPDRTPSTDTTVLLI